MQKNSWNFAKIVTQLAEIGADRWPSVASGERKTLLLRLLLTISTDCAQFSLNSLPLIYNIHEKNLHYVLSRSNAPRTLNSRCEIFFSSPSFSTNEANCERECKTFQLDYALRVLVGLCASMSLRLRRKRANF